MKKIFLLLVARMFLLANVNAQDEVSSSPKSFSKGDKVLNVGIGIGSTLYSGSYYTTQIPPLSASLEVGLLDDLFEVEGLNLGVGGYIGFSRSQYKYSYYDLGEDREYEWGWRYTYIIIGARGVLHYQLTEKLDTYTGLLFGPNIVTSKEFGDWEEGYVGSAASSGLAYSYFIGARYYISDSFGLMGELGYGISYLNLGVSLKF